MLLLFPKLSQSTGGNYKSQNENHLLTQQSMSLEDALVSLYLLHIIHKGQIEDKHQHVMIYSSLSVGTGANFFQITSCMWGKQLDHVSQRKWTHFCFTNKERKRSSRERWTWSSSIKALRGIISKYSNVLNVFYLEMIKTCWVWMWLIGYILSA